MLTTSCARARRANAHSRTNPSRPVRAALYRAAAALLACAALLAPSFVARRAAASGPSSARDAAGIARNANATAAPAAERDEGRGDAEKRAAINSAYGRLPVAFVANEGQLDPSVTFSARGAGYQLFLTDAGALLALDAHKDARAESDDGRGAVSREGGAALRMNLLGARRASGVGGEGRLEGRANFFVGSDPSKWRTNVQTYSAVRYEGVYPGVDLVYHGDQQQLEYDFRLAPGADPQQIKIGFDGARSLKIDREGQLLVRVGESYVTQRKPVAYQLVGGKRREVPARYRVNARGEVTFKLGRYDHSQPLVIDPVISYATYLGGSGTDQANAVAVDSAGNAYVVGYTNSLNFPTAAAMRTTRSSVTDAFVTKINAAGTALVYSTYLSGSSADKAYGVAVDSAGSAYVTGRTFSDDFPHTAGAYQQARAGSYDAFVTKLTPAGDSLVYSTFVGGNNDETGYGIGLDSAGDAFIAGGTTSTVFAGTPTPKRGSPAYRSTDAGDSWSPDKTGIADSTLTSVTIDPVDHNTLYASGSLVFKSTDGGSTWSATPPFPTQPGFAPYPYSVTVDPVVHTTLYAASPGGLYKSTDAGGSWAEFDAGLQAVGAGGGTSQVLIDPTNHTTLYAPNDFGGIYKSTDGGASWKPASTGMISNAPVSMLALDPTNPSTLYAATFEEGLYKSTNAAASWSRANTGFPPNDIADPQSGTAIDAIAVDPSAPSTVYAYTSFLGVYKSTNGGANWSASSTGLPLTTDTYHHIAIDPTSPSTLYAAASFGVYKTTDSGAHWSPANNGLANKNVTGVAVDPAAPSRIFVTTDSGQDAFVAKLSPNGSSLGYMQYLGGDEDDFAAAIAVDSAGDAHVVGTTHSSNFPVTNPLRAASSGLSDAFVAKLTPAGAVAFSTYLGGDGNDTGEGVALDGAGRIYVTGTDGSTNFPVTVVRKQIDPVTALQRSDVYLARFTPNGSALDYSFAYGGSDFDEGIGVAADAAGNAYVAGFTISNDFPVLNPAQGTQGPAFLLKFDASGNNVYSTTFGAGGNTVPSGVAADGAGAAYVAGKTDSPSIPVTASAFQRARGGGTDGFVIKFQAAADAAPLVSFSQPTYQVSEGAGRATLTVVRSGDASQPLTVSYQTVDDPAAVRCDDTVNNHGAAFARCDYATTIDSVTFAANDTTPKQITVPIIDDSHVEGDETFQVRLFNPVGATLGSPSTATVTIIDNDAAGEPNPILGTDFFVRQQYLDFLSRDPEPGQPWSAVLNNCAAGNTACDRVTVSSDFFLSQEFQLKGLFVFKFYKAAFGRMPLYTEIVSDMSAVTGSSTAELIAKKAAYTAAFAQRQEFTSAYGSMTNQQFVDALMGRYSTQSITTPDPANPDGTTKVTLSRSDLVARLGAGTMTRGQVVRAVADSNEVNAAEFNPAFVAMQYFGYLRRDPDAAGYNAWLNAINANPSDTRTMVNGFVNSIEYRLRFGQP